MSEETSDEGQELVEIDGTAAELGPTDMVVIVQKGAEFEASERVESALAELADALAAEESDDVSGFSFEPSMALDSGFAGGVEPLGIGCVRVGCLRGGGGGTNNCESGHVVIKCRGSYTVETAGVL